MLTNDKFSLVMFLAQLMLIICLGLFFRTGLSTTYFEEAKRRSRALLHRCIL